MSQQYWIGGFYIDLSRNQISQNNQSKTLAPKALAVLTYLAEHQGKVVSQDDLLTNVWKDTIVSPNTLQRSIAQLRKALGDDGKGQLFIKTHAKKGYSLECDVRWQEHANLSNFNTTEEQEVESQHIEEFKAKLDQEPANDKKPANNGLKFITFLMFVVALAAISFHFYSPKSTQLINVTEIRALTATDNKEFAGIYSPDGQYVVFHRYSEEFCINNIWAKNTKTQQEFQLTNRLDTYGNHTFSQDGKQLIFVQEEDCRQPIVQKKCYKLMTLDFVAALSSPQQPSMLLECKNSEIRNPKWLNNGNITLLQKYTNQWKLISFSIAENKSQDIYQLDDGNILTYDYSPEQDLIALTSIRNDGNYYIELIKPNGELVSSNQIIYPPEIAKHRIISPRFAPFDNQLVFGTGRQLFTMSYQGEIKKISLPLDEFVGGPVFHPDGSKMLVIKGYYDADIVSVPLSRKDNEQTVIERSILGEDDAIFQPNGNLIAFRTERSGDSQVWLTDGSQPRQLSQLPMDSFVYGLSWAKDGQSLLINSNKAPSQVFLDGTKQTFSFKYPIEQLFQWDSENQTALARVRINGLLKFAELNLANSEVNIINNKRVFWAQRAEDGQLIYTDHMDRFWQPGPAEDKPIAALDNQGSDKRFVIKNNTIYGVNEDFQLWSYDLKTEQFEIIKELPKNLDYLTDANEQQLLISVRVSAKKEVAELILDN